MSLEEGDDRGVRTSVLTDREHLHSAGTGQLVESRQFLDAWGTLARPEVHEDGLAFEVGYLRGLSGRIGKGGAGRRLAIVIPIDALGTALGCARSRFV